ncbi:MAG: hypothetical protein P1P88_03185, partial [Bacteroidales bacterium]|nr:hypothetical protein [Bacteroidales bacterium]
EKYGEWLLDSYVETKYKSVLDIYDQLGQKTLNYEEQSQIEKDSLGHMRYIILTEKDNIPFIISSKPEHPEKVAKTSGYNIFRYVVNDVK